MSVSLYYTARRSTPITQQERNRCDGIAERYDRQYPFGELYEGFCIYDWETGKEEKDVILDGATKLPPDVEMEFCMRILDWWLECLTELTDLLGDAQWKVHLDDMDSMWSAEKHCFLPDMVN